MPRRAGRISEKSEGVANQSSSGNGKVTQLDSRFWLGESKPVLRGEDDEVVGEAMRAPTRRQQLFHPEKEKEKAPKPDRVLPRPAREWPVGRAAVG